MNGGPGVAACDTSIQRLIDRAARLVFAQGTLTSAADWSKVSLPATRQSLPEYYGLERYADREAYHARLQTYMAVGAVMVEWDRGAGDRGQLKRLTLVDPKQAAAVLECSLPWEVARAAIRELEAVAGVGLPCVDHIIEGWSRGKAPGGVAAGKARQFVDGLKVIAAAQSLGGSKTDILLRRVSAQLFGDTKRIEALARPIAFLLEDPEGIEDEDVFARLGLVKHPQPMLLSGSPACLVRVGDKLVPLVRPYLGLRPDTIEGLQPGGTPVRCLLTIENLASFNEAAQASTNPEGLLLVYVAGNPTPALLAAYQRLLASVRPSSVLHWGDIDLGGFRIASRLADAAKDAGYRLDLWRMDPARWAQTATNPASDPKVDQIARICEKHSWAREIGGLRSHPVFQEQEAIAWESPLKTHISEK